MEKIKELFNSNKLGLLIILGIIIRIIFIIVNSLELHCDEAMLAINAKSLAEYGVDIWGTSFPVYLEAWRSWWSKCVFSIYNIFVY